MTNEAAASAWDFMSDTEKVEWLATEVMGWKRMPYQEVPQEWVCDGKTMAICRDWNPLTDWNHWRQVEEKVMEDEDLFDEYRGQLFDLARAESPHLLTGAESMIRSDLPTRGRALYSAFQSPR